MSRDGGEERSLDPAALSLEIDPGEWNLNFDRSQGTVEAFIRGEGFDLVDLDSIELEGDDPAAAPLAARSASRQGDHVHARFAMNGVIDLLLDPAPGSTHTVVVTFMEEDGGERFGLEAQVTIEDDGDEGEDDDGEDDEEDDGEDDEEDDGEDGVVDLRLDIQPDSWNTNWLRSNGTVSALIRGSGFDKVDLDSIVLVGSDPAAGELAPERADAQGNHVRAFFAQSDAFMTLLDADTGQTHVITIRFSVDGEEMELTDTIRTVGPAL
jgi:succinyl-CoA synthetase beta subunit